MARMDLVHRNIIEPARKFDVKFKREKMSAYTMSNAKPEPYPEPKLNVKILGEDGEVYKVPNYFDDCDSLDDMKAKFFGRNDE